MTATAELIPTLRARTERVLATVVVTDAAAEWVYAVEWMPDTGVFLVTWLRPSPRGVVGGGDDVGCFTLVLQSGHPIEHRWLFVAQQAHRFRLEAEARASKSVCVRCGHAAPLHGGTGCRQRGCDCPLHAPLTKAGGS